MMEVFIEFVLMSYEIRSYTDFKGEYRIVFIDDILKDCTKESFIGYCQYKNVKFLDFIIEEK